MASGGSAAIDECAEKRRRLYNAYKDTKNEPIPFKKSDYNLFFAIRSSRTDNVRFSIRAAKPVYGLVLRRTARLEEYVRLKSASAASYTQEKSVRYVRTILSPRPEVGPFRMDRLCGRKRQRPDRMIASPDVVHRMIVPRTVISRISTIAVL